MEELFDFSYRWEIYTPAHRRTGGPYTMPLYGSSLVGRLDAHADRDASTLVLDRIAYEPDFTPTRGMKPALEKELDRLRAFCGLEGIARVETAAGNADHRLGKKIRKGKQERKTNVQRDA